MVHVGFPDPPKLAEEVEGEEEKLNCYRRVRDEIKDYIERFLEGLIFEGPSDSCSGGCCGGGCCG